MIIYVSYDPALPYPQDALFGRGVKGKDGTHVPPAGLSSFGVEKDSLTEGTAEHFYEVTAPDTLAVKAQQDVDDIKLAEEKELAYPIAEAEAERRVAVAELNPSLGVTLDEKRARVKNNKRNARANKKVNTISDADDNLYDHIDQIYDSLDQIYDSIEAASDSATLGTIVAGIPNNANWPTWSPI